MPIEIPPTPPAVIAALKQDLPQFAAASRQTPRQATRALSSTSTARTDISLGQLLQEALAAGTGSGVGAPVTVLGLEELVADKPLRQIKPRLWAQLLPVSRGERGAVAEVDPAAGQVTAVSEGPQARVLATRIAALDAEASRSRVRQTLAIIRVPALHLTALWLQGAEGDADDVVIPNDGPIDPLKPGYRYPLSEFRRIVKVMATERLANTKDGMGG